MQIKIFHRDVVAAFADEPGGVYIHVANFAAPEGDVLDALEAAFAASQNMNGSWSKGRYIEGALVNDDYNPAIERIAPLPEYEGKQYGLRSSSVGDLFVVGDDSYKVASCGFALAKVEPVVISA